MSDKLHTVIECEICNGTGNLKFSKKTCCACAGTGVRNCVE